MKRLEAIEHGAPTSGAHREGDARCRVFNQDRATAGGAGKATISSLEPRKLQDRLRLFAVAICTQVMNRVAALTLRLERIAKGTRSYLLQGVALALGRKGMEAANFLSKLTCSLLAFYVGSLGRKELARQIAELADERINAQGDLGIYFEFQYRLSCLDGICKAAGYGGESGQVHGEPPVENDEIGICHSATASAPRYSDAGDGA